MFSPLCTFGLKVHKNIKYPHHTRELPLTNAEEDCKLIVISPTVGTVVTSLQANKVDFEGEFTVTNLFTNRFLGTLLGSEIPVCFVPRKYQGTFFKMKVGDSI